MGRWLVLAGLLGLAVPAAAASPWAPWEDLRELARVGGHASSLMASSWCLDGCRYDRSSVDPGRGGQRMLRIDATPEGEEAVIFEQPGAGAVTRIWMTSGDGTSVPLPETVRLRIYFDGEPAPRLDLPLPEFFTLAERALPMRARGALAADRTRSSGGNVSMLPLQFRDGIRISLLHGAEQRLWYQINFMQVAHTGPDVPASSGPLISPALARLLAAPADGDRLLGRLRRAGRGDEDNAPGRPRQALVVSGRAPVTLAELSGGGWITALRIHAPRARWQDLRLQLAFDGATTVDVPLAEFFGADADDRRNPRGVFAGVDASGSFTSAIPMPFREHARVAVVLKAGAAPVDVRWELASDPAPPPADAAPLVAQRHEICPTRPEEEGDVQLLKHAGSGRMLGLALWMQGDGLRGGGYYLEGDERLYIDGSRQPLWYGTGVEDFFNGGFYFDQGEMAGPLAGATLRQPAGVGDRTFMYRWFLGDAPAWRNAFEFRLENGAWGDEPMCLRSLALMYAHDAPSEVRLAWLEVGTGAGVHATDYQPAPDSSCGVLDGWFASEPPALRSAGVCTGSGRSRFRVHLPQAGTRFRLRRTFDAGVAGQAATVQVNGERVGAWPAIQANPHRRWAEWDLDFQLSTPAAELEIEIESVAGPVSESRYELWGTPATAKAPDVRVGSSPSSSAM